MILIWILAFSTEFCDAYDSIGIQERVERWLTWYFMKMPESLSLKAWLLPKRIHATRLYDGMLFLECHGCQLFVDKICNWRHYRPVNHTVAIVKSFEVSNDVQLVITTANRDDGTIKGNSPTCRVPMAKTTLPRIEAHVIFSTVQVIVFMVETIAMIF